MFISLGIACFLTIPTVETFKPDVAHAQSPVPCSVNGTFSTATTSAIVDNRRNGCYQLRLAYQSTGFSALSIQVEWAPDNNGGLPPTSGWAAFAGSAVSDGINPTTNTAAGIIGIHATGAWLRVNLASATGTGVLTYSFWCANSTSISRVLLVSRSCRASWTDWRNGSNWSNRNGGCSRCLPGRQARRCNGNYRPNWCDWHERGTNGATGATGPTGATGAGGFGQPCGVPSTGSTTGSILLTANTASMGYTSIPSTSFNLRLIVRGRSTSGSNLDFVDVQFNGDTGANYNQQLQVVSTAATATPATARSSATIGGLTGGATTSGLGSSVIAEIPGYTDGFQKNVVTSSNSSVSGGLPVNILNSLAVDGLTQLL